MNLIQAKKLAIELMSDHGLLDTGWSFELDNAKTRFGVCRYRSKRIGLSQPLTLVNNEAEVRDTILHEIAHALTPGHHHDSVWKAKCREIGCRDERCYTKENTVTIAGKYKAVCGGCGKTFERMKRVPRGRKTACLCQNKIKDWSKKKLLEYKVAR
jgi:predicted SprT family Zn-dependent metalloprotease